MNSRLLSRSSPFLSAMLWFISAFPQGFTFARLTEERLVSDPYGGDGQPSFRDAV